MSISFDADDRLKSFRNATGEGGDALSLFGPAWFVNPTGEKMALRSLPLVIIAALAFAGMGCQKSATVGGPAISSPTGTPLGLITSERAFLGDVSLDGRQIGILTDSPAPYVVSLGKSGIDKQGAYSPEHSSTVLQVAFRPSSPQLLSSDAFSITLWDATNRKRVATIDVPSAFKNPLLQMDFVTWSSNGEKIFAYCSIAKCILSMRCTPAGIVPVKKLDIELSEFLATRLVPSVQDEASVLAVTSSGGSIVWDGVAAMPTQLNLPDSCVYAFDTPTDRCWLDSKGVAHLGGGREVSISSLRGGEKVLVRGDVLFVSNATRAVAVDLTGKRPGVTHDYADDPGATAVPLRGSMGLYALGFKGRQLVRIAP